MSVLAALARRLPWRGGLDPRTPREVEHELADELDLHLALRAADYEREGCTPEEAARRARERFGDVEKVRAECRAIQLRERLMVQRVQWVVILFLIVVVAVLGYGAWTSRVMARQALDRAHSEQAALLERLQRAQERLAQARVDGLQAPAEADRVPAARGSADGAAEERPGDADPWRARLAENPDSWRHGWNVVQELVDALPPEQAIAVFSELWPDMTVAVKEQALKPFVFGEGHPFALAALDLAARDAALSVQGRAFTYLRSMVFQDFSEDYDAYLAWSEANRDRPLGEVLTDSGRDFVARLQGVGPEEAAGLLERFARGDWDLAQGAGVDLRAVLREAGATDLAAGWLQSGDREAAGEVLRWVGELRAGEAFMREHVLPVLGPGGDPELVSRAARAFARDDCTWAAPELTDLMLERAVRGTDERYDPGAKDIAQALGEIGDPRSIPAMIAMLEADRTGDTVYWVGYFGLGKLTGVPYDESHDGAWWRAWWENNQARLPESVQGMAIPDLE